MKNKLVAAGQNLLLVMASVSMFFLLVEGSVRFLLKEYVEDRESHAYMLNTLEGEIFRETTVDGEKVYYSRYFPVSYYHAVKYDEGRYLGVEKGPSTYRIFVFGGSSAAGSPFGFYGSFSRFVMDALRNIARPGATVDVFNLAMSGGTTNSARFLMDRSAFLDPDLVIVYAGHNEICDVGSVQEGRNALVQETANWVYRISYAYRFLSQFWFLANRAKNEAESFPFSVYQCLGVRDLGSIDAIDLEKLPNRYRNHLQDIMDTAHGLGADVLLVSQVANHFHIPQDFAGAPKRRAGALTMLEQSFRAGEPIDVLVREVLAEDPTNPVVLYYQGLTALNEGDLEGALVFLEQASEYDRLPRRFRPSYTAVLEKLASESARTHFIDVRSRIRELVPDGLVDGRVMIDSMHPTMELNRFIARRIIEDFFLTLRPRQDLFAYDHYDLDPLLGRIAEERHYGLICERYHRISDWSDCLKGALTEYEENEGPTRIDSRHRSVRVWENMFYFGRVNNDRELLAGAFELVAPWRPQTRP